MREADMNRVQKELGFSLPPYRLDFENQRTDFRIGVIGLHWVMQIMHLPAYRAAGFNVVAAAEIDEDKVEQARRQGYDIGRVFGDWPPLVELDEVDVIDCTFGHSPEKLERRLEVVKAAAEAGKHVMMHKPVARSVAVAQKLAEAAREGGIRLAVNQNCRYNPAAFSIKGLLTEQRLGRPGIIEVQNYWQGSPVDPSDPAGAYVGHTIHHADLIRWWVGRPCVSVSSRAGMKSNLTTYEFEDGTLAYHMENHSGVENHETKIRVMAENGVVKAAHNWNWHFPSSRDHDFVEVYTDRNGPGVRLPLPHHVYEPTWSEINPWIPHSGPYYDLAAPVAGMMGTMGSLMRGVERNEPPDNHAGGAIESLRMCLAAQLSAGEGRPVDPREVPPDVVAER
ncbi:MAG: Gfo/Idh/MocA family protein [Planctomycetota bacterium]